MCAHVCAPVCVLCRCMHACMCAIINVHLGSQNVHYNISINIHTVCVEFRWILSVHTLEIIHIGIHIMQKSELKSNTVQ